jgi:hypothetical protein
MGNESAIIIPIPEIETIVRDLRLKYDPAARLGVPAHVTILYPFYPPELAIGEIDKLRDIFASIEAFSFSFTEVRRFSGTAYLHPDKADAFAEITSMVVKTWPTCKPYGGIHSDIHSDIIPHLTVADHADSETLSEVEGSLHSQLPVECFAREGWLLTSDHAGMWSKKAAFAMATR